MATEHQLEVLNDAHQALLRAGSFEQSPREYIRADNRLFDACVSAGMDARVAGHGDWAAERLARWLVAA